MKLLKGLLVWPLLWFMRKFRMPSRRSAVQGNVWGFLETTTIKKEDNKMEWNEQETGRWYATDREAREYLVERGKKISGFLTTEEISADNILTSKNCIFINESQRKRRETITETCKPEEYRK
jgi:hypothetical protein